MCGKNGVGDICIELHFFIFNCAEGNCVCRICIKLFFFPPLFSRAEGGNGVCRIVVKCCLFPQALANKICLLFAAADESLAGEVYLSDEEDYVPVRSIPAPQPVVPQSVDVKME